MLTPLLLAAAVGAVGVETADRRRAKSRLQELQNRLGIAPTPAVSDLRTRYIFATARYPSAVPILTVVVSEFLAECPIADDLGLPESGLRNRDIEPILLWLTREIDRGISYDLDFSWEQIAREYGRGRVETFEFYSQSLHARDPHKPAKMAFDDKKWTLHGAYGLRVEIRPGNILARKAPSFWFTVKVTGPKDDILLEARMSYLDLSMPESEIQAKLEKEGLGYQWHDETAFLLHSFRQRIRIRDRIGFAISQTLPMLLDWVRDQEPDLWRMSWRQAVEAEVEWHRQFEVSLERGAPVSVFRDDRILTRWPDGDYVVLIQSKMGLAAEGTSIGHCVGTYWPKVRDRTSIVFSYRDGSSVPVATWEFSIEPESGKLVSLVQIQGDDDGPIEAGPDTRKVQLRIAWFLRTSLHVDPTASDRQDRLGLVVPNDALKAVRKSQRTEVAIPDFVTYDDLLLGRSGLSVPENLRAREKKSR